MRKPRDTRPWWGDNVHSLVLRKHGMLVLVNAAFVHGDKATCIPVHPGRELLEVVGPSCPPRIMGDQATARDAQAECAPVVMHCLAAQEPASASPGKP